MKHRRKVTWKGIVAYSRSPFWFNVCLISMFLSQNCRKATKVWNSYFMGCRCVLLFCCICNGQSCGFVCSFHLGNLLCQGILWDVGDIKRPKENRGHCRKLSRKMRIFLSLSESWNTEFSTHWQNVFKSKTTINQELSPVSAWLPNHEFCEIRVTLARPPNNLDT